MLHRHEKVCLAGCVGQLLVEQDGVWREGKQAVDTLLGLNTCAPAEVLGSVHIPGHGV